MNVKTLYETLALSEHLYHSLSVNPSFFVCSTTKQTETEITYSSDRFAILLTLL